jgi:hypothetical protein
VASLSLSRRCQYAVDRALVGHRWHAALAKQFGPLTADSVMARVWRDYLVRLAALPPAGSVGSALVQRWTMLAIAVYRALVVRGHPPELARSVLRNLAWDGYRVMGAIVWVLAWRPGRSRLARTRAAMRLFRRLYFAEPDFTWRDLPDQAGRVGFDCLRCPIERAFAAEGLGDVIVHSICSLERRLSASWGMRLVRSQTLADGGSHCEFRWYAGDARAGRPGGGAKAPGID